MIILYTVSTFNMGPEVNTGRLQMIYGYKEWSQYEQKQNNKTYTYKLVTKLFTQAT